MLDITEAGAVVFRGKGKRPPNLNDLIARRDRFKLECFAHLRNHIFQPYRFALLDIWALEGSDGYQAKHRKKLEAAYEVMYSPSVAEGSMFFLKAARGGLGMFSPSPGEDTPYGQRELMGLAVAFLTKRGEVLTVEPKRPLLGRTG